MKLSHDDRRRNIRRHGRNIINEPPQARSSREGSCREKNKLRKYQKRISEPTQITIKNRSSAYHGRALQRKMPIGSTCRQCHAISRVWKKPRELIVERILAHNVMMRYMLVHTQCDNEDTWLSRLRLNAMVRIVDCANLMRR